MMGSGWAALCCAAVLVAGCTTPTSGPTSPEDLAAASDRLRPSVSKSERDDFIEGCLADEGSAAFTRNPIGGFSGTNVNSFDEAAMASCVERSFDRWPNPPQPSSAADFEVLYTLYLAQVECLREFDIAIDPPSLETYVDGGGFWIPYDDVPPQGSADDRETTNKNCPQDPWSYDR
jgi:hypothetical protein